MFKIWYMWLSIEKFLKPMSSCQICICIIVNYKVLDHFTAECQPINCLVKLLKTSICNTFISVRILNSLHKKWNAGQHAILKRSLIISFLSNSFAKNLLCVHTNLIVCCNSIMNYIPWVNYADLLVFIIWWLDVNQCVQWSNPVLIVGWTV